MASTEFSKAAKARLQKSWKKSRTKTDPYGTFSGPDGTYTVKLSNVNVGVVQKDGKYKGAPFISFNYIVTAGEFKGQTPGDYRMLVDFSENYTIDDVMDSLTYTLQKLGVDTEAVEIEDLEDIAAQLSADKPTCKIKVSTSKNKSNGQEYQNVNLLGLSSDDAEDLYEQSDEPELKDDTPDATSDSLEGTTVQVAYEDGEMYEATILGYDEENDSYSVEYASDGSTEEVSSTNIIWPDDDDAENATGEEEEEEEPNPADDYTTYNEGDPVTYNEAEWTIKSINEDGTYNLSRKGRPPKKNVSADELALPF